MCHLFSDENRDASPLVSRDEQGSAVAEFAMVSALLVAVALAIIQLALACYVRNTVLDAASEGAQFAARADASVAEGVARTRELITHAVGASFASSVYGFFSDSDRYPTVEIHVQCDLPIIGLVGVRHGLELSARAPHEAAFFSQQ